MEGYIAKVIGRGGLKDGDQIPNTIQVNPITNPLQILQNGLESEDPKAHNRGSEAGYAHIATDVHHKPIVLPFTLKLGQHLLNRLRDVGSSKRLAL